MPRQARLDAPGTLHHVMIRGIEGSPIFKGDEDRSNFLFRLSHLVETTGTKILAWVLMDNHIHLLIFSGYQGISKFMRCLLTGYAISFNRKYRRKCHLFQNRYKSIVCDKETYLLELVRYIHLNPLRAGVVKGVRGLDRYMWSGHSVLIGKNKNGWQEREYVLSQFSHKEGKAIQGYSRFMEEGKGFGRREELAGGGLVRSLGGWSQVLSLRSNKEKMEYDSRILGGGDFVSKILTEADKGLKRQLRLGERKVLAEQMIKKICKQERINEGELCNGGRRRKVSRIRERISYYLSRELGMPSAEIARQLGVCTSAIVKAIQNAEVKIDK